MKRITGGCDFGVLLYLFAQLLYVFLQDVFTMFSGKPMGAISVFMQGTTSANLEEDDGLSFPAEVVIAACYFLSFPDLQKIITVKTLPLSKSFQS